MENINKNTTIFVKKDKDSDIYYIEIADDLNRKKIADIELKKITPIRYHITRVQTY